MKVSLRGRIIIILDDVDVEQATMRFAHEKLSMQDAVLRVAQEAAEKIVKDQDVRVRTHIIKTDAARVIFEIVS